MTRPITVLLVEDNPGDARLVIEALKEGKVLSRLKIVRDGVEAMMYLRQEAEFASAERPHLVLLDLNLPRKDGREVLAEVKQDPALRRIPIVVLTSSRADEDIAKAYDLHANCYVTKPLELGRFISVVRSIEEFWVNTGELPR
jgi:CheY-like chemotaxis protein